MYPKLTAMDFTPGVPGGADVGCRITDHYGLRGAHAGELDGPIEGCGVGLPGADLVITDDRLERAVCAETLQDRRGQRRPFVGADTGDHRPVLKLCHRCQRTRKKFGVDHAIGAVILQELVEHPIQFLVGKRFAQYIVCTSQHLVGAAADQGHGLFVRQGRLALPRQSPVEGRVQVRAGIGEGAVEIEDDGLEGNGHKSSAMQSCVTRSDLAYFCPCGKVAPRDSGRSRNRLTPAGAF